jgi:hypothetical protein
VLSQKNTKKLSPAEIAEVERTLALARQGRATLVQLAVAHDLASGACLSGTLGELREHIRRATPKPPVRDEMRAIVLGFLSGLATHAVLNSIARQEKD